MEIYIYMCSSLQRFSHKPNERFKNSPFPKKILKVANALNLQLIRKSKHYSTISFSISLYFAHL